MFDEKREPKQNQTDVHLLNSLAPYCLAKMAHAKNQMILKTTCIHVILHI